MGSKIITSILDTNVVVRFLVGDNIKQQEQAVQWFAQAEAGKRKIIVRPLVIAESCFVLESFYKKSRAEIADTFEVFLSQKWLDVVDRDIMLNVWPWYRKKFHFVDSFLHAAAQLSHADVLTFDQKLSKSSK